MNNPGFMKKAMAMVLAGTMSALGCVGSPDPLPEPVPTDIAHQNQQRVVMDYTADGKHVTVDLVRASGDTWFRGYQTVVDADGSEYLQWMEVPGPVNGEPGALIVQDEDGSRWLEFEGHRLPVTAYELTSDGVTFTFVGVSGTEFTYRQSASNDFYAVQVVLGPAAVVAIVAIGVCGLVAITSIIACAVNGKCWSYSVTSGGVSSLCTGNCTTCPPPPSPSPSPIASATPQPSATATATATATPQPSATATATATPLPSATASATPLPSATASASPEPDNTPDPQPSVWSQPSW